MSTRTGLVGLSALLILALAPSSRGGEPGEDLRATIALGSPAVWTDAAARTSRDLEAIAHGLIDVSKKSDRSAEDRAKAIRLLGKLPSSAGLSFCLENLQLKIDVETDEDFAKAACQCQLALVDMGFRAVPDVLGAALSGRSLEDCAALAWVLVHVISKEHDDVAARAIARDLARVHARRPGTGPTPGLEPFLKALGG